MTNTQWENEIVDDSLSLDQDIFEKKQDDDVSLIVDESKKPRWCRQWWCIWCLGFLVLLLVVWWLVSWKLYDLVQDWVDTYLADEPRAIEMQNFTQQERDESQQRREDIQSQLSGTDSIAITENDMNAVLFNMFLTNDRDGAASMTWSASVDFLSWEMIIDMSFGLSSLWEEMWFDLNKKYVDAVVSITQSGEKNFVLENLVLNGEIIEIEEQVTLDMIYYEMKSQISRNKSDEDLEKIATFWESIQEVIITDDTITFVRE